MPASASFSSWFSSWGAGKMRFSTPTSLASALAAQEAASERRRLPAKKVPGSPGRGDELLYRA
jgi:hypothetical protein